VFAEELGADLADAEAGLDRDGYDSHCRHLLVRDLANGEIVACTRLLTGTAAAAAGGYYSKTNSNWNGSSLDPAASSRSDVPVWTRPTATARSSQRCGKASAILSTP
jgi:hypothetical protein